MASYAKYGALFVLDDIFSDRHWLHSGVFDRPQISWPWFLDDIDLDSDDVVPAVVGNFWAFLYQPQVGLFNYVAAFLSGVPPSSFSMLGSVALAPWAIVVVDTWMWTPYVMLICLAGLRSIPDYIYEAAEVDRASRWRQFWSITLPMVLPFVMLAVLFRGIENFKMFDMVNLLTSGGPGSATELASITLKREAFEKWRTGYSSAFAVILFVAVFGMANMYVKALNYVKNR